MSSGKRSFAEKVNTWFQTGGILIAAIWGVYTFYFTQIKVPKSALVNISLNLQLKKLDTGATQQDDLTPVEVKISATNPSPREIFLLPSAWVAWGGCITPVVDNEVAFTSAVEAALKDPTNLISQQRHAKVENTSMVAAGHLFDYTSLRPGETTARTIVFYLSKHDYDEIYFSAHMPSAPDIKGLQLEWTLEDSGPISKVFRIGKQGERIPLPLDKDGVPLDKGLDLQTSTAHAEISLRP